MSKHLLLSGCFVFSALLTGCATTGPEHHEADLASLKAFETEWSKSAADKSVETWVQHYTDDASVLLPNAPIFTGKAAITAALKPLMADPNYSLTFGSVRMDVAKSGELGFAQGTYTMTLSDSKTKAPTTEKGKYLTVYQKQADGNWKAVEDTFMADEPAK